MGVAASGPLYASVKAHGAADCASRADSCTLSTALARIAAGGVVELITPGSTARYVGNWTVTTADTSARHRVTIEALAGLSSAPILDGDGPDAPKETCSTASCDGPVLTVPAGEHVTINGIAIDDGDNGSGAVPGHRPAGSRQRPGPVRRRVGADYRHDRLRLHIGDGGQDAAVVVVGGGQA
jgi:hypothetical protein